VVGLATSLHQESPLEEFVKESFVDETPFVSFSVFAAMDKFRGTATARELCDAISRAAVDHGRGSDVQPMSDGGEGFRDAFVGEEMTIEVPGPLGAVVPAKVTMVPSASGPLSGATSSNHRLVARRWRRQARASAI
jgi:glycerate kinase